MLSDLQRIAKSRRDGRQRNPEDDFSYAAGERSVLRRTLIRTVEQIGGQRRLKRLYDSRHDSRREDESFFETAVRLLGIDVRFDAAALARIPAAGPVLFVANHPFGILDGVVLTWLAMKVRPDVKVLVHSSLTRVPEARPYLLPVDFSETAAARGTNVATRASAVKWLADGHAVGVFPGGAVSTVENWSAKEAHDLPWAPFVVKMIRATRATVVPIYFSGQNSRLFQLASQVSLTLRLSLLMHETARRIGTPVNVAIGAPVAGDEVATFRDPDELLAELRRRTYSLGGRTGQDLMRVGRIPTRRPPSLVRQSRDNFQP